MRCVCKNIPGVYCGEDRCDLANFPKVGERSCLACRVRLRKTVKATSKSTLERFQRPSCRYLGSRTGEEGDCKGCGMKGRKAELYTCLLHTRCSLMFSSDFQDTPVHCCRFCADYSPEPSMKPPLNWMVGVTTVPQRRTSLLPRTLVSLQRAGFKEYRLFVDGCSPELYTSYKNEFNCQVTLRDTPVGVVGNWILSFYELYHRNSKADRYLMVQDDVLFVRNLRAYLEQSLFPQKGYANLYTMSRLNEAVIQGKPAGWYQGALCNPGQPWQVGRSAMALVFTNEGATTLLKQESLVMKPKAAALEIAQRAIDGGIANAMNTAGWREYIHNPSLVQHLGLRSTLNPPAVHPLALTFPGEDFDARDLLLCLTPTKS